MYSNTQAIARNMVREANGEMMNRVDLSWVELYLQWYGSWNLFGIGVRQNGFEYQRCSVLKMRLPWIEWRVPRESKYLGKGREQENRTENDLIYV